MSDEKAEQQKAAGLEELTQVIRDIDTLERWGFAPDSKLLKQKLSDALSKLSGQEPVVTPIKSKYRAGFTGHPYRDD